MPMKIKTDSRGESPLMKQYYEIKSNHPDAILLFRVGDFYETFDEDARILSRVLGITLTKRAAGTKGEAALAGFPYHALDTYLPRLVRAGYRVAICEQLEEPKPGKKLVKRGVVEVITPGILTGNLIDEKKSNFLAAINKEGDVWGIALLDINSGEFYVVQGNTNDLRRVLKTLPVGEVLVPRYILPHLREYAGEINGYPVDEWMFDYDHALMTILDFFKVKSVKGFGLEKLPVALSAAGAVLQYLRDTYHSEAHHIMPPIPLDTSEYVWLDQFTIRNLELVEPMRPEGKSLYDILDECVTPMGSRLLQQWILLPLKDVSKINKRLDVVEVFVRNQDKLKQVRETLREIGDVERLVSRLAMGRINPKQLYQLGLSLRNINELADTLPDEIGQLKERIVVPDEWIDKILKTLVENPPQTFDKGGYIADGVDETLDEYRNLERNAKSILIEILEREKRITGIPSLKIGYNQVFGYYFEVTNAHKNKVPETWVRRQTLRNVERFVTDELKELESRILEASEKVLALEKEIYDRLREDLAQYAPQMSNIAKAVAQIDVLSTFAHLALKNQYVKPEVSSEHKILIQEGRHPVLEKTLPLNKRFVPNDVLLDQNRQQIMIITGPNMAGKSVYLRQVALITLMAQIGCFVPASHAHIGIADKIFSRVGASDNISAGESTFMVEMTETASILHMATARSLVLLDEIGRGTSTYDGLSIAWAVVEYLHDHPVVRPRTLFATHYHELADLSRKLKRVRNYTVLVREQDGEIVFLYKVAPGVAKRSFGIEVARMAGLPETIIRRAREILAMLESKKGQMSLPAERTLFSGVGQVESWKDEIVREIKEIDINRLTPVEALLKLAELQKKAKGN